MSARRELQTAMIPPANTNGNRAHHTLPPCLPPTRALPVRRGVYVYVYVYVFSRASVRLREKGRSRV